MSPYETSEREAPTTAELIERAQRACRDGREALLDWLITKEETRLMLRFQSAAARSVRRRNGTAIRNSGSL